MCLNIEYMEDSGSNVKCLTSIMMVKVRLGLGYCLVAAKQLCHIQSSY